MPFIPVPNVVKLEAIFNFNGQICENVHHYEKDVAWDVASMQNLASEYIQAWTTFLRPTMTNEVSLSNIKVTDLTTQFSNGIEYSTGLPLAGSSVAPASPNNVTLSVTWVTAFRGRSFRGRTYHIGLKESEVGQNEVTVSYAGIMAAFYGALFTSVPSTGETMVVVSYREGNAPRAEGLATPIIGISINRTVDSQRRRLPGRGA